MWAAGGQAAPFQRAAAAVRAAAPAAFAGLLVSAIRKVEPDKTYAFAFDAVGVQPEALFAEALAARQLSQAANFILVVQDHVGVYEARRAFVGARNS